MPRSSSPFTMRAGAIMLAAFAAAAMPQPAFAQPSAFRTPQFKATAVSFKALHETHANWLGSDEVYGTYYDFTGLQYGGTGLFGDVDAGETRNIPPGLACISVRPTCDRGASSLGFGIVLMEDDDWGIATPGDFCHGGFDPPRPSPQEFEATFDNFKGESCSSDDLIGKAKVKLTQEELVAALPAVGMSFVRTVPLTGGDGTYEFTYRVTRLTNAINIPPIGPPVSIVGITLDATVNGSEQVILTWSGATTASVDIYRDAMKVITTANDGNHTTTPQTPGMHQFRLCELNSTTVCSADVAVVVP